MKRYHPSSVNHLILLSRPGCHLCEEMKSIVQRVRRKASFEFEEIDISKHPDLETKYDQEIPVLILNGRKVAKYTLNESRLLRQLGETR